MRNLLPFLLLLAGSAFAADWTGLVTCEKCKHTDEQSAQSCALTCVKNGVQAGFISAADKQYYKVANQDKVREHVGHTVTSTGTLKGDTITVDTLKMAAK
jgi:hypothetical protein